VTYLQQSILIHYNVIVSGKSRHYSKPQLFFFWGGVTFCVESFLWGERLTYVTLQKLQR